MNLTDELDKLNELHRSGALSDDEFREAKRSLFAKESSMTANAVTSEESTWALLIHLTQFGGYLIPLGGWLIPLTLWLLKKNESRFIDIQGRIVMNWLLSEIIYGITFGLLCIIVIGIPFVIVLGILSFVYPIVGGIKASSGEIWNYPGSLRILDIEK